MKLNFLLLTILSVATSVMAFGQTKYIKTTEGEIVDTVTYAKLKDAQIEKMKSIFPTKDVKITIKDIFKEIKRTQDSLIYSYKWDIKIGDPKGKEEKSFVPDDYIDKEFPFPNLKTLDNKKIGINDLKGKPTLINFWFTTCKPCIEEMPVLNKIKNKFKDSVNFIAVNYEQTKKVRAFLLKHKYNFIQIANAEKFTDSLEMTSFPVNIFLDRNGKVIRIENGIPYIQGKNKKLVMGDGKDFEETLRKLL